MQTVAVTSDQILLYLMVVAGYGNTTSAIDAIQISNV
jgi:hypothetical protein